MAVFPAPSGPLVAKKVFALGQVRCYLGGCPYQILSKSGKAFGNETIPRQKSEKKIEKKQWPEGILGRIQKVYNYAENFSQYV